MIEQEARKQIDRRVYGLKVRLGQARARAKRAETLNEKIARYARTKEVERDLHALQGRDWQEVGKLEAQALRRHPPRVLKDAPPRAGRTRAVEELP